MADIPAGFNQHALVQRVNHAHAVCALQDGLYDADCQSAMPVLHLMPAQHLLIVTQTLPAPSSTLCLQICTYLCCSCVVSYTIV